MRKFIKANIKQYIFTFINIDSRLDWFHVGEYKQRSNMAGDFKTVPPGKVQKEMQKLLSAYQQKDSISFEDIVAFHYSFEKYIPFRTETGE